LAEGIKFSIYTRLISALLSETTYRYGVLWCQFMS